MWHHNTLEGRATLRLPVVASGLLDQRQNLDYGAMRLSGSLAWLDKQLLQPRNETVLDAVHLRQSRGATTSTSVPLGMVESPSRYGLRESGVRIVRIVVRKNVVRNVGNL
ncbi:MAG: hypothetical protein JWQ81_894 [Amycolatopsis sp.]|nr:hypothetical protein [Amycolatopsis sp.]